MFDSYQSRGAKHPSPFIRREASLECVSRSKQSSKKLDAINQSTDLCVWVVGMKRARPSNVIFVSSTRLPRIRNGASEGTLLSNLTAFAACGAPSNKVSAESTKHKNFKH